MGAVGITGALPCDGRTSRVLGQSRASLGRLPHKQRRRSPCYRNFACSFPARCDWGLWVYRHRGRLGLGTPGCFGYWVLSLALLRWSAESKKNMDPSIGNNSVSK